MTAPWAVLQHVPYEGPGTLVEVLHAAGLSASVVRLDRGEAVPAAGSVAGVVALGGPMGVHDTADHPWLVPERDLLAATARDGLPVVGVCLGGQQLALALGAEVFPGPEEEIGTGQVELTPDGRRDPVLGPEYGGLGTNRVPCVHWHRDTFSLPEGAVHLAATRRTPHQAFRWGERAYGFQFHLEVDAALAAAWGPRLPEGTRWDRAELAAVESVGRRVLTRLVARLAAPATAPAGAVP